MKLVSTYKRRVKTSRHFVFENIMDLDHVCVVHLKWFRNLRVITRKSDYVEYRLTSYFYGFKQEILARGAPIDANRYWYEFISPLAQFRVEGQLEGPDGDLIQAETITCRFPWVLAPAFWVLGPLFSRQKKDILLADTRLLERVYSLSQAGFKRLPDRLSTRRIVVYGGSGFFGRLVVEDLLNTSDANIVIAGRHPKPISFQPHEQRVQYQISDINDYASALSTIEGADIVVCCIGPYQRLTLNLLRACIEKKVHYVDVADDNSFVKQARALAPEIEQAGIIAFIGCSVVPGLSSLLTGYCQEAVSVIEHVKISISPGTKHPRGRGSFACLLSTLGERFLVPRDGSPRLVKGWSEPEKVDFPIPLKDRWVYSVVDIPDYDLQPLYFGTRTVEFKIGSESRLLNHGLTLIRWLKEWLPNRRFGSLIPFFRGTIYVASFFGTSQGGLRVEVIGPKQNGARAVALSVFTDQKGERIPAILPSIAAQMILNREWQKPGVVYLPHWLSRERLNEELQQRGIQFASKDSPRAEWVLCA